MIELCVVLVAGFWTETKPQDFIDGQYDPLLYVSRRLQVEGMNPADSGAVEFYARFDANRDGYYDLTGAEEMGEYVKIFFGSPTGYSDANVRLFPISSGGNCDMADLNLDGWPELIHSGYLMNQCYIYWGSQTAEGPDPDNFTCLPQKCAEDVFVYDLDKDTYLDVILGDDGYPALLRVYWGGPGGYSPSVVSTLSVGNGIPHNLEVVDLNKDGYPDIVFPQYAFPSSSGLSILWGDGDRDLNNNLLWNDTLGWDLFYVHGLTLSDFNNDNWIDIVLTSCHPDASRPKTAVYFSDNGSFSRSSRLILTLGPAYGGSSAWDLNHDGWLDLVLFRGADLSMPLLILLNKGSPPYFVNADTAQCGLWEKCSGGFIYDFNRDGKTDIFANSAQIQNDYVYWGVQPTGTYDSVQTLSVNNDHHGGFRECGNVYDRSPTAWYESGVFSSANLQSEAVISWIAWDSVQISSVVRMYIRTRRDGSSPWTDWREVSNGETVSESPYFPARDIQYRAEFVWQNPAWLPWLERVEIQTAPLYEDLSEEAKSEQLRFGSGKGLVWVSWPGKQAEVSLYSADGRMQGQGSLQKGRLEFRGLNAGVYYLWIEASDGLIKEKVLVR